MKHITRPKHFNQICAVCILVVMLIILVGRTFLPYHLEESQPSGLHLFLYGDIKPEYIDSDYDGLRDKDELDRGTDPNKLDTDGDGMADGWEVEHGTDPVVAESHVSFAESKLLDGTTVTLNLTTEGKDAQATSIVPMPSTKVDLYELPGFLAGASFLVMDTFTNAHITFSLPKGTVTPAIRPVVYFYDSDTNHFEEQPTTVSGNDVSFSATHLSIYLVMDANTFTPA